MGIADRRTLFERSLRRVRCSYCGSKILEVNMPNVICSNCSRPYILAVSVKGFFLPQLDYKLIPQSTLPIVKEVTKEVTKEKEVIVKIRCSYCGKLHNEIDDFCPYCGGKR
jgi:rRNA maturation endonuclease Nob1